MRFTTAFVALLALTPVLCAPVPTPGSETVDSLARSANRDASVLVKKLAPIAQEIVTLLGTMTPAQGADKAPSPPAAAAPAAPSVSAAPAPQPDGKDAAGGNPSPPAAQPEAAGNGAPANAEPATPTPADGAGAESPASASPTEAPDAATVQRRDVDPPAADSAATPTSTSAPAPSASSTEIKPTDVYKLRTLLARATMYEQAIEQILLAQGKNIEERPTSKTAGGVAWGIANGPIMAVLGVSGLVQKQPS